MKLSVIVPVYNEQATVGEVIDRALAVPISKEVIVVDDGSTDDTPNVVRARVGPGVKLVGLQANRGKGAAIREGLAHAAGDYVLIQDGDLELCPEEYPQLLEPIRTGRSRVVYGSRFRHGRGRATWRNYLANRLITCWTNLLYGSSLTDVSTGYKLFPRRLVDQLDLRCERFEFCAEITAKLLRMGFAIAEIPVTYVPRPGHAGKKLSYLRDGLRSAWTLARWRFWRPSPTVAPAPCIPPAKPEP